MIASRARYRRRQLIWNEDGVAGVEFAVLLPLMLVLFFGGITIVNVINVSRKITITTRALADLTTQYTTMAQADMNTVMNASAQILAPYSSAPLGMRISELYVTVTNASPIVRTCTVVWSSAQGPGMTAYKSGNGSTCTVPTGLLATPSGSNVTASLYVIYAETSYTYTTIFGNVGPVSAYGVQWLPSNFGTYALGDSIFMLPRQSSSISYSGS